MKLFSFLSINFCLILKINLVLTRCPKGTIEGLDSSFCYKFYGDPTDFWSANAKCQQYNGNLASITSTFLNGFISETLLDIVGTNPTQVWIGGTKNFTWSWIDGNPFSFNSWAKGQPSLGNCTAIVPTQTTSNWYSNDCQNREPFLCEIPAIPDSCPTQATTTNTISTPICPPGYSYFHRTNFCYKFVTKGLGYDEAESNCQNDSADGHLVSIHSPEENEFIDSLSQQYSDSEDFWIGLFNERHSVGDFFWIWTDQTSLGCYNDYAPGYVKNVSTYYCTVMLASGYPGVNGKSLWGDIWPCTTQFASICKTRPICSS